MRHRKLAEEAAGKGTFAHRYSASQSENRHTRAYFIRSFEKPEMSGSARLSAIGNGN
jgi:hypothetical protein